MAGLLFDFVGTEDTTISSSFYFPYSIFTDDDDMTGVADIALGGMTYAPVQSCWIRNSTAIEHPSILDVSEITSDLIQYSPISIHT